VFSVIALALIFVLMLLLIRYRVDVSTALVAGAVLVGLLFGIDWPRFPRGLGAALLGVAGHLGGIAISAETLQLLGLILLITFLGHVLRHVESLQQLMGALKGILRDRRAAMAVAPAFIGLLPMPGGALFSAPMVGELTEDLDLPPEHRALINFWFRHVWELTWPLYPGLLVATVQLGVPFEKLIAVNSPMTLGAIAIGVAFCFRGVKIPDYPPAGEETRGREPTPWKIPDYPPAGDETRGREPTPWKIPDYPPAGEETRGREPTPCPPAGSEARGRVSGGSWTDLFAAVWPVALLVALTAALATAQKLGVKLSLSTDTALLMALVIVNPLFLWFKRVPWRETARLVRVTLSVRLIVLVFGVMAFGGMLKGYRAADTLPQTLADWGIPGVVLLFVVPMAVGLLTGYTPAFVAICFPVLSALMVDASGVHYGHIAFAFAGGFLGVLLSPVHLCLVLTAEYFKADFGRVYRRLVVPAAFLALVALGSLVLWERVGLR